MQGRRLTPSPRTRATRAPPLTRCEGSCDSGVVRAFCLPWEFITELIAALGSFGREEGASVLPTG